MRSDLNIKKGAFGDADEASLCALTAFEVARRLVDEDNPQSGDVSAKLEASIQTFGVSLGQKIERLQLLCCDRFELPAYYLPAGGSDVRTPAVICISKEDETAAALLARLLPVAICRGLSILVVSHEDVSNYSNRKPKFLLSCCLDYLSDQPQIDVTRIGIYGEGLSAAIATDFAASDRRIAAAVCDAGVWIWARSMACVDWMTRTKDGPNEEMASTYRTQFLQKLRCPVLVVAGGRGIISVPEAIKLKADCTARRVDLELIIPQMIQTPAGDVENFVASDDCIFTWLERKLAKWSPR
ncbi:alpha/beta hydrolase family protein [Bradyrhizobium ganzhouense]|uniref:alpha/beta hydrolase family protein n=1 Tax=Bradyrhizobium ganzhouense TaxID=1179767 RepID=UPI003CE8CDE1